MAATVAFVVGGIWYARPLKAFRRGVADQPPLAGAFARTQAAHSSSGSAFCCRWIAALMFAIFLGHASVDVLVAVVTGRAAGMAWVATESRQKLSVPGIDRRHEPRAVALDQRRSFHAVQFYGAGPGCLPNFQ